MSTIKVENIRIASEAVSRPVTGVAAAYWNCATTYTLGASLNISSMTDNGTGNYDVYFSNAFTSVSAIVATYGVMSTVPKMYGGNAVSASQIECRMFDSSGSSSDNAGTGNVQGDLA